MESKPVLPLQVRVDLRVMAMKKYSKFPQSFRIWASPSDGLVSQLDIHLAEVLFLCRGVLIIVFYKLSWYSNGQLLRYVTIICIR